MSKITTTAARLILLTIVCGNTQLSAATKGAPPAAKSSGKKSHYERAVELYTLGPSKAAEILREVDLELAERPGNSGAYIVKAMTLMGVSRCPEALKVVKQLEDAPGLKGKVFPAAINVRARCLYYDGKYAEAKAALEPFRESFQQKEEWRKHYSSLMQAIDKALQSGGKQ
ncbi:MAG TPA: hypothetical protein VN181_02965 [Thermoanaerobaculia bacterium]|nr:hypothetical protein [Thermoanaerobaculia bacterium]